MLISPPGSDGDEEEVVQRSEHRLDRRRVVVVGPAVLAEAKALEQRRAGEHEHERDTVRARTGHRAASRRPTLQRSGRRADRSGPRRDYTSRVITVRFTFSQSENQRAMVVTSLLRSRVDDGDARARARAARGRGLSIGKTAVIVIGAAELSTGYAGRADAPFRRPPHDRRGVEQTMSFSEDGVTAANASGEGSFDWRHWTRWMQTGDLYVLTRARDARSRSFRRRAFASPDAESEFRELLARHIGAS